MDEQERYIAWWYFCWRSEASQNGWAKKGGPLAHLTQEERKELAQLRAQVHLFILEHPPPRKDNPDMPFRRGGR